jgi:hypothetical protein
MPGSERQWQEAKQKCRLNAEDIALAKRLGLNPKSLVKNIPSKSEPWKAPVKVWLHEIDEKRKAKSEQKRRRKEKAERKARENEKKDTQGRRDDEEDPEPGRPANAG